MCKRLTMKTDIKSVFWENDLECKTEREVMICMQALRMLRKEPSEVYDNERGT